MRSGTNCLNVDRWACATQDQGRSDRSKRAAFSFTRPVRILYVLGTLNNPLLAVNWSEVRMISFDSNGTLRLVLEEGEPLTFSFGSRERMDDAFKEWIRSNDPLLRD